VRIDFFRLIFRWSFEFLATIIWHIVIEQRVGLVNMIVWCSCEHSVS
jgi:hypothetical protein